jgi:hypothetical protein
LGGGGARFKKLAPAMSRMRAAMAPGGTPPPPPAPAPRKAGIVAQISDALFGERSKSESTSDLECCDLSMAAPAREMKAPEPLQAEIHLSAYAPSTAAQFDLMGVTGAQRFDGSFGLTGDVLVYFNRKGFDLEKLLSQIATDRNYATRIIATLVALQMLELEFSDRRDEWKMLADKAERWLAKQGVAVPAGFADLKAWAKSELKM